MAKLCFSILISLLLCGLAYGQYAAGIDSRGSLSRTVDGYVHRISEQHWRTATGCVLWLNFNETGTTNWDYSHNTNYATGGLLWTNAAGGCGYSTGAADSTSIIIADEDMTLSNQSFTVMCWIYPRTIDSQDKFGKYDGALGLTWHFQGFAVSTNEGAETNVLAFTYDRVGGTRRLECREQLWNVSNEWTHLAVIGNAANTTLTFVVNGMTCTNLFESSGPWLDATGWVSFGGITAGTYNDWLIDDFRVYRINLGTNEVTEIFNTETNVHIPRSSM